VEDSPGLSRSAAKRLPWGQIGAIPSTLKGLQSVASLRGNPGCLTKSLRVRSRQCCRQRRTTLQARGWPISPSTPPAPLRSCRQWLTPPRQPIAVSLSRIGAKSWPLAVFARRLESRPFCLIASSPRGAAVLPSRGWASQQYRAKSKRLLLGGTHYLALR
jgi:hypothetical protein